MEFEAEIIIFYVVSLKITSTKLRQTQHIVGTPCFPEPSTDSFLIVIGENAINDSTMRYLLPLPGAVLFELQLENIAGGTNTQFVAGLCWGRPIHAASGV
jgi:hypothetical protein